MPSRRTTLAALGALAAGSVGAVATGAFSAATAERDVTAEFEGDSTAVLAFHPTSDYAAIDDTAGEVDVLSITFDNLSANADFTFQDTFRVVNNGTDTVRLDGVGSSGDDADWNNETEDEEEAPGRVLIANEAEKWQGSPNPDYVGNEDIEIEIDEEETGYGHFPARELDEVDSPQLEPGGGWVSIGFRFAGTNGVGDWHTDDLPETLQLEFGSVTDD